MVDMDGNAEPVPLPPGIYHLPRFSPDGTRLAYNDGNPGQDNSTWVYDIAREISTRLPKPLPENENGPFDWSPDGTEIVFSSGIEGGPLNLYVTAADGSGEPERLTESETRQQPGSWSSNGVLAFVEERTDGSRDILILPMDGDSEPTPFHRETPFEEMHPAFSPNGNWLAYTSDENGQGEVLVRPFPAGEPAYLIGRGRAPVWSPNGDQLFYRAGRGVMVVEVPGGSISARSRPRVLFEGPYLNSNSTPIRGYDVAPDGDLFVIETLAARVQEQVTRINIIQNWFEALAELVPVP